MMALIGLLLSLDVVALTVFLSLAGGLSNPLSALYLVLIAWSTVVLSRAWTLGIAALCVAGFASLFLVPLSHSAHGQGAEDFAHHLQGMFLAFVISALLMTYFIGQVVATIADQRRRVEWLRKRGARDARLAAVTTLAAGAAHELGNPLGTIAIAAHKAALCLDRARADREVVADLQLIMLEVRRCRDILAKMRRPGGPGLPAGGTVRAEALELYLGRRFTGERGRRLALEGTDRHIAEGDCIGELNSSIGDLVDNALEASAPAQQVQVLAKAGSRWTTIKILDRGRGPEHLDLDKVGVPFFTTKPVGQGMGLGVFLARARVMHRGGRLSIGPRRGGGTRVLVRLPERGQRRAP